MSPKVAAVAGADMICPCGTSRKLLSEGFSGAGPVKTHKSLTRERFVRLSEARRVKEWLSNDVRRDKIWRRESVANVSCWNPKGITSVFCQINLRF